MAPGYVQAMMVLSVSPEPHVVAVDPADHPMQAAGDKVTINYRYCSNHLDMTKDTLPKPSTSTGT